MRYLLGIDIGSSSVKVSLVDADSGLGVARCQSPEREMDMASPKAGWAEQDPESWWQECVQAMQKLRAMFRFFPEDILAVGISYQMHGLVCLDAQGEVLRPSIIWCDSRAVKQGIQAEAMLGKDFCLRHYLNTPGNFTASKLAWVKQFEPHVFEKIHRIGLPGDYIAYRLTGEMVTTDTGLSEGILYDYTSGSLARELMDVLGIPEGMIAPRVPAVGIQGYVQVAAAELLGIQAGIPVSYRAGDQPNNAMSLQVLQPGEVAATAGTSGVVYAVTDQLFVDPAMRVNAFLHVNHSEQRRRLGVLLCVNGTGILYSWLRRQVAPGMSYAELNELSAHVAAGSEGLRCYPFGNGAERILGNRIPGASFQGLDFNRHHTAELARAAQEGIVYALTLGMEVFAEQGVNLGVVKAGYANLFLSPVFAAIFSNVTGVQLQLMDTDGATGAARAAGVGTGVYSGWSDCFRGLEISRTLEPDVSVRSIYQELYLEWKEGLRDQLESRI